MIVERVSNYYMPTEPNPDGIDGIHSVPTADGTTHGGTKTPLQNGKPIDLKVTTTLFNAMKESLRVDTEEALKALASQRRPLKGKPAVMEETVVTKKIKSTRPIGATINPATGKPYPFFSNHTEVMGKPYENDGFRDMHLPDPKTDNGGK
jgi:hypothetical protein